MTTDRPPRKRRQRLWHLSALLAGLVILLANPAPPPGLSGPLSLVALAIGPPISVASAWGRRMSRAPRLSSSEFGRRGRSWLMTAGFVICLVSYYVLLSFMLPLILDQWNVLVP